MLEYENPNARPSLPSEPAKKTSFWIFLSKNTCMGIFQKVLFYGEAIIMCVRLSDILCHPSFMKKELKSKCSNIFSEQKTPKGGYIKGVREEGGKE